MALERGEGGEQGKAGEFHFAILFKGRLDARAVTARLVHTLIFSVSGAEAHAPLLFLTTTHSPGDPTTVKFPTDENFSYRAPTTSASFDIHPLAPLCPTPAYHPLSPSTPLSLSLSKFWLTCCDGGCEQPLGKLCRQSAHCTCGLAARLDENFL